MGQGRVKLPAIAKEGLLVDLLLGVNWIKEAREDINFTKGEIIMGKLIIKLKTLPVPSTGRVVCGERLFVKNSVNIQLKEIQVFDIVHNLIKPVEVCYVNSKQEDIRMVMLKMSD